MTKKFRATGMWPFSIQGFPPADIDHTGLVFDRFALEFAVSPKLIDAHWVGLAIMDDDFLFDIYDAQQPDVELLVENWVTKHVAQIGELLEKRLSNYPVDALATRAMTESILSYRKGSYLSTVRTVIPEYERCARLLLNRLGQTALTQKAVIEALQDFVSHTVLNKESVLEDFTGCKILEEDVFANFSPADLPLSGLPNRHAELHGFDSYGNLRGATVTLVVQDLIMRAMARRQI